MVKKKHSHRSKEKEQDIKEYVDDVVSDRLNERIRIKRETMECTASLFEAIAFAGGRIPAEELLEMDLESFILNVASQNQIHFVCNKPLDIEEPDE